MLGGDRAAIGLVAEGGKALVLLVDDAGQGGDEDGAAGVQRLVVQVRLAGTAGIGDGLQATFGVIGVGGGLAGRVGQLGQVVRGVVAEVEATAAVVDHA